MEEKKKALRVTKTEHFQLVNDISKFIMQHLCHFTILKDWNEQKYTTGLHCRQGKYTGRKQQIGHTEQSNLE